MQDTELKDLRLRLGLTQEQMAHALGVTFTTFSKWERGLTKPSPLSREKIDKIKKRKVVNE